uniref:Uncharacterized protein n=1 Tax=Arundo donax TaxID=35708 RepID=A0A0A9FTT2_ARUDO
MILWIARSNRTLWTETLKVSPLLLSNLTSE